MSIALTKPATTTKTLDRLQILNGYLRAADQLLAREGYDVFISEDLRGWVNFMNSAPGTDGVNPTFNPDETGPHDQGFWLGVTRGDRIVSVFACRLYDGLDGYYDMIRQGLLWSAPPGRSMEIQIEGPGPSGIIAHPGGHWVHPEFRGRGLSWLVPRYGHAFTQLIWPVDFVAGVMMADVKKQGITFNYGTENTRLLINGWFWPKAKEMQVYSTEYSIECLLSRAQTDRDIIVNEPHKNMVDFAPIARKRDQKLAVAHQPVA
jgi:hypothetical protein